VSGEAGVKEDLALLLREILPQVRFVEGGRPDQESIRARLREKGISEHLIDDALFLLDLMVQEPMDRPVQTRPARILSSEELRGLNLVVVGKLFRLYYLGYMNLETLETVMTQLLFVPSDLQPQRAQETLSDLLEMTSAQARFLMDGGSDATVMH